VIIDTLHLTQCVRPGAVGWSDVASIDDRLAALGCKLVSLRASSQRLWERGIEPRKNEQFLLKYAKKFGNTNEEIHAYFVREQEILADLFSRSVMPKLFLANDIAMDTILEEVYQFWLGDTGGTATPEADAFGRQP
jgi:hypothetical protein